MMINLSKASKWVGMLFKPIQVNGMFFLTMYLLGVITEILTLPNTKHAHLYSNLWLEMFLDVYAACVVLTVLPRRVRWWVRRIAYFVLYASTVADVFCFVKFNSTLTPTMLLLVGETDAREAEEFLSSYLSADVLFSNVGWILLFMLLHFLITVRRWLLRGSWRQTVEHWQTSLEDFFNRTQLQFGILAGVLLVWSSIASCHNKVETVKLMTAPTVGSEEHLLALPDHAVLFTPIQRLLFSVKANQVASRQLGKLMRASSKSRVDSCSFRSPCIVLIIGESYGKSHSALYGYFMPDTPRQLSMQKRGRLVPFTDVVSPWNLTSFVFKNVLSMHVIGGPGEWCDYPLFPQLFRQAGYEVTFLTNQFLPQAREAVYDFSGGFFLNHPQLSRQLFDNRNATLHPFDEGLLTDYDNLKKGLNPHSLIIFHLIGQHVSYHSRYPRDRRRFTADDYTQKRPELGAYQRRILADYDNSILYNDSIVYQICRRFANKDAIVIYMPDHGEECYEGTRGFFCRNHSSDIDYPLAHYEFEIPFWIWCSHPYAVKHPELFKQIVEARNRRFMTDALPHLLLYLAGIKTPYYNDKFNLLSPAYDESRPRLLKGITDYDKLRQKAGKEPKK